MKIISVIIPIYNAENWIEKLIESLENQTVFDELEIIFVNDGSTDNSCEVLEKYCKKNQNMKLINKKNGGVSSARNEGIKNSTCKYIAFVDADDYLDDDYFELYKVAIKGDYDLITSGYIAEYSSGKIVKNCIKNESAVNAEEGIKSFLLGNLDPNCWNKLYKKEIIEKILFNEKLKYGEDKDLLFKYLFKVKKIYRCDHAKYHYIINDQSAIRNQKNRKAFDVIKQSEEIIDKISREYPNLKEYAVSSCIDAKCRVLCTIIEFKLKKEFLELYKYLKKEIKKYSICKKKKYSTKKHFYAFLAVRISPRLYIFLKKNMKMQYK